MEEAYDDLNVKYEDKCTDVESLEEQLKLKHEQAIEMDARIRVLQDECQEMTVHCRKYEHAQGKLDQICAESGITHEVEKTGKSFDGTVSRIHGIISKQGKENQKIVQRNNELEDENSILKEKLSTLERNFELETKKRSSYIESIVSITQDFYPKSKSANSYSNLKNDK